MKDFTVDDFVRFKNLEFQMESANKKKEMEKIIRDIDVISRDNVEDVVNLSFDEVIEKIIQEYFRNNKGEENKGE